jgi:hypothetical protein
MPPATPAARLRRQRRLAAVRYRQAMLARYQAALAGQHALRAARLGRPLVARRALNRAFVANAWAIRLAAQSRRHAMRARTIARARRARAAAMGGL